MMFPTAPLVAAALSLAPSSGVEMLPSFHPGAAAWAATDVVVVTEGEAVDGRVTVLEAWLGDAEPGTELAFEALGRYGSDENRTVQPSFAQWLESEGNAVERVTGDRMVLFLDRDVDGTLRLTDRLSDDGVRSVAWLEGGRAFARIQAMNPGGNGIRSTGATDTELRKQVDRTFALRDAMDGIEAFADPLVRVMAVAPHCHDRRPFVQDRAFEIIVASGPSGVDHLRSLALDVRMPNLGLGRRVIRALSESGSETLVATLTEGLEAELEYWTSVELPESWWNSYEPTLEAREYRQARYGRLLASLRALDELSERELIPAFASIHAIETLWQTRPELLGFSNPQVRKLCERIRTKHGE